MFTQNCERHVYFLGLPILYLFTQKMQDAKQKLVLGLGKALTLEIDQIT